MNVEQTFQLMDSLLPYEICSYHQILPLAIQGESLILGMVNPDNVSVLDYVRPILKPKHYFIKRRTLEEKVYKEVLTKYREYQRQQRTNEREDDSVPTLIFGHAPLMHEGSVLKNQEEDTVMVTSQARPNSLASRIDPLNVQMRYATASAVFLAQLPPHELMPELLGRSLLQNITQLSFERQQTYGRIIWSRQNRSKIFLEKVPVLLFQGLIHELKRLTEFPVKPVDKPKKIEMLRLYENKPVLLRLRFVPSQFGEQVAIQFFRDQLLQKYQKSQMDKLSEEIIQITNSLDQKLKQAAARTQINPEKIEALPALQTSLINMNQYVEQIQKNQVKR